MRMKPIAIIGAACRFPGAEGVDRYWNLLIGARDAVSEIPSARWAKRYYFHPDPTALGKSYTWAAGVLDGVDGFDAAFFGISPREAEQIDPQQRLLLELAWEAFEDAGVPAARLAGSGAGVYVGASATDHAFLQIGDPATVDAHFMTGNTLSILANRISYVFDLHGPSLTVDTACSSSLVALNLACSALAEGRVPLALVGGVNILLSPYPFIGFSRASMLSRRGRCYAFDQRADGYVRAEGGAVVALKPLAAALADGNAVRGVILASGVNSDGRTTGLSLPSRAAQARLLRSVYAEAEIAPERLAFVEAHGTGTPVGDPLEAAALGEALARHRAAPLPIGSVKSNLGHLEAASGMAGLVKAMLALEHRVLPPSIHCETPNPQIPFAELNLRIAAEPLALAADESAVAGVNSFGFGGTNAHAILAPPPNRPAAEETASPLPPLLLSARAESALRALADEWSGRLAGAPAETAVRLIRAAARRRDHHKHRLVALGATPAELARSLRSHGAAQPSARLASGAALAQGKLAFVFSANGSQWPGMARDALAHSAAFRDTVREVDALLRPLLGWSVRDRLEAGCDAEALARTDCAQPLLFAVQVGITAALREHGVAGAAHLGYSVGEIAACWAAGALTLGDAARVIVMRSRQQQRTHGMGRMAALALAPAVARDVIARLGGGLEIAAVNSAAAVTVAGPETALAHLRHEAERQDWRFYPLDLAYAFHSAAMDEIEFDLIASLEGIAPKDGATPLISTVTGDVLPGHELGPRYWWRNIREPVQFADAVARLVRDDFRIFLEIGPNPILQSYIRDQLREADVAGRVLGTLTQRPGESDPFAIIAAKCHVAGHDISGAAAFDGATAARGLPHYPWQRQRYAAAPTVEARGFTNAACDHPLLGFREDRRQFLWLNHIDTALLPWLADHKLDDAALFPAAAFLEMAFAAARLRDPDAAALAVTDFEIRRPLALEAERTRELRTRLATDGRIEIESRSRLADEPWILHAVGRIVAATRLGDDTLAPLPAPMRIVEGEALYRDASKLGFDYGPRFRTVARVEIAGARQATVQLDATAADEAGAEFVVDPALLDGALQGFLALLGNRGGDDADVTFLPWRFGRLASFEPYGRRPVEARLTLERIGTRSVSGAIVLLDGEARVMARLSDCWFRQVHLGRRKSLAERSFHFALVASAPPGVTASPAGAIAAAIATGAAREPEPAAAEDTSLLLDAFLAAAAHGALTALIQPGAPFAVADLAAQGTLAAESAPLCTALLRRLEEHGAAGETGGAWTLESDSHLPEPGAIWRSLLADAPALVADLALAANAGEALSAVLRQGSAAAPVLPAMLIEHFLYASPSGERAVAALCERVVSIATQWPADRPLRILEIGTGQGVLARRLLAALAPHPVAVSYAAMDPDGEAAARPLAAGHDLIVSAYGLTRLQSGGDALARLGDALAPGGAILAVEPAPNALWDVVFGLDPAWWQASVAPDFPISPLCDGGAWDRALEAAGFRAISSARLEPATWPVMLVIALADRQSRAPAAESLNASPVVLIADPADALARRLAARLKEAGLSAQVIFPPSAEDGAALLAALREPAEGGPEVMILPPNCAGTESQAGAATARLAAVMTVVRLMAESRARLWIVTCGAHPGGAANAPMPAERALWGMARTIANEAPNLACRRIDLAPSLPVEESAERLVAELLHPDVETELIWHPDGRRFVPRLRAGLPRLERRHEAALRLSPGPSGQIDALRWEAVEHASPGPGEVAIAVKAAGLNFRDVMWAMELLPEEALLDGFAGPSLGIECSGIVGAVGPGVEGVSVGDRVAAFAPASLASHVVTAAHAVVRLPESVSFAAGATLPVAFLTAVYALGSLAQLAAGERVLIHGGAGGVGLAAITYAKHRGAIVFATAGSGAKRAFLRQLGVDHVLDSRSLAFADEVMDLTGGAGVDVVLNSLGGEAMERSLGLLRPFGRFLELGKRDFYLNTRVGLRPLRQNISYFAIDADQLPSRRPELAAALLREVMGLLEAGALRPLPYRVFPFAEASDAFRLMQASGHIGKIVLVPGDEQPQAPVTADFTARPDGTYVVSGGLTGFGLATAQWLAAHGARHFALLGRRGAATPGAAEALAALAEAGAEARAFACDVADPDALAATLAAIRVALPPIRGIVHAAMVVEDGLIGSMTVERLQRALAPKLHGAENFDRLTRADPVELFLLYSSATTVLGAPGQGGYVAANSALEAMAERRCALGQPALTVAWGPIGDVGYLARDPAQRDALARRLGAVPMSAAEALDSLPALLAAAAPVAIFAVVDWSAARRVMPVLATPIFADFAAHAMSEASDFDLRAALSDLAPEEARELVLALLVEEVGRILRLPAETIDPQRPLPEIGMDSLMAVELRLALERRLGINLPLLALSDGTSLASMAAKLLQMLGKEKTETGAAVAALHHETAAEIAAPPPPAAAAPGHQDESLRG
ncbi:MAG TPA: SDR family NAD(P)-dependent oxidoreductase [Stellaceae bacterium]|nr:SDR family NAD(P)-dependent oxidoreductase [Stellaceae bacterium]